MTGGLSPLTAILCIAASLVGAVLGPWLLSLSGVSSPIARGLALGATSHGVSTAHAFTESEETGAWSALAMCISGVLTALLVPFALALLRL